MSAIMRSIGRIKFFDAVKGFGFIVPDDGGKDLFVHRSDLPQGCSGLASNTYVEYDKSTTDRGGRATIVTLVL